VRRRWGRQQSASHEIFETQVCEEKQCEDSRDRFRHSSPRSHVPEIRESAHGRAVSPRQVERDWQQSLARPPSEERERSSSRDPSRRSPRVGFGGAVRSAPGAGSPSARPRQASFQAQSREASSDSVARGKATAMFGDFSEDVRLASLAHSGGELRQIEVTSPATGKQMYFFGERQARSGTAAPAPALRRGTYVGEVVDAAGVAFATFNERAQPDEPARCQTPWLRHRQHPGATQEHSDQPFRRARNGSAILNQKQASLDARPRWQTPQPRRPGMTQEHSDPCLRHGARSGNANLPQKQAVASPRMVPRCTQELRSWAAAVAAEL